MAGSRAGVLGKAPSGASDGSNRTFGAGLETSVSFHERLTIDDRKDGYGSENV